jgi:hypothetical protein
MEKDIFELDTEIVLWEEANPFKIFDNQLEKARDSIRKSDLYSIKNLLEIYFSDNWFYPSIDNFNEDIYIDDIPEDPSKNIEINSCKFGYTYEVDSTLLFYKLSSCLEYNSYTKIDWSIDNIIEIWNYEKDYEFNDKIYINNYTNWINRETKDIEKVIFDINIKSNTTWNKNNWNIYIDVKLDDKKVIEFEIDNKSTKIYQDVKILAPLPNDTIPLEEVIENPVMY